MGKSEVKIGMLPLEGFGNFDSWYSYLINDYIPNKHPEDMELFIETGFNPEIYLIYRLYKANEFKKEMQEAIKKRFKKEFNIDI